MNDHHVSTTSHAVAELQQRIRSLERGSQRSETVVFPTGCPALDTLFPLSGIRQGSVVEWIASKWGSGAGTLSLMTAQQVCPAGRPLVVIDPQQHVYPLAMKSLGVELSQVVIVRPTNQRDVLWACEEALRSRSTGIVWANVDNLSDTAARRLRLAAEDSSSVCFLVRPHQALRRNSWAEVRLVVEPMPSRDASPRYQVSVAYCQGRTLRSSVDIKLDRHRGTIDEFRHSPPQDSLLLVS